MLPAAGSRARRLAALTSAYPNIDSSSAMQYSPIRRNQEMETATYEVKGELNGQTIAVFIVDRSPSQAHLTVKELWPGLRVYNVNLQPEWSDG